MESCLFIGGSFDGLNYPVWNREETVAVPVGITGSANYVRDELRIGDVAVPIYRYESVTAEQALALLVKFYKAWAVNQLGGKEDVRAGRG
jgi:hypothetical protein